MKQRVWTVSTVEETGWHVIAVFDNEAAANTAADDCTRSGTESLVARHPVERTAT